MKRKIFSILLTLVLVLSFSLVTAVPAAAAAAQVDSFALGVGSYSGTPASTAEWSTDQQHSGSYAVRLDSGIQTDQGDEAMIVIPMPARTTLADIESIAWSVFTVVGYPPHVDIYLDVDGDTVVDPEDVLTAEMAYNNAVLPFEITDLCALVQHDTWLQTFELAAEDGFGAVDADSIIWLSKLGGGPGDAPAGTLAQWKAGVVGGDPEGEIEAGVITGSAPVLRLEIEVDNWIIESEAYVDDIEINDVLFYDLELPAERPLTVDDDRAENPNAYFQRIQSAIDCAIADEIISVAAGEYAGAVVNEDLTITGAAGGASIITSGVIYKAGGPSYYTGFRLDDGADGAEIRNFTMNGDYDNKFWFGVFARSADSVIVDSLALNDMVQGITNWGGSNWEITNNVITETYPTTGGGIAIYLGADPTDFPHCDNNLVQYNIITTSADQSGSFTKAAICLWFDMRDTPDEEPTTQSMTGNEIIGNSITASGLENQVGIEIGVGGLEGDENPDRVAACLGVIHDNTVTNNTIDNAEWGLYTYVTTDLTVQGNTIKNCSDCGIYMKDDHANCLINYNDIYGNTNYGLNNTDGATYERTVDATKNWWGNISGPKQAATNPRGEGDEASAHVLCKPWLTRDFQTVLDDNIAYFGYNWVDLSTGWNTLSTPIALDPGCDTWGEYVALGDPDLHIHGTSPAYSFNAETQTYEALTGNSPLKPCDAILVRMAEPDIAPILFSPQPSAPAVQVEQGWNLVGLSSLEDLLVQEALVSLYKVAGDLTGYSLVVSPPFYQAPWTHIRDGEPQTLEKTKGYWVFMENGPDTLAGFTFTPFSLEAPPPPPPPPPGGVTEVDFQWYPVTEESAGENWDCGDDNSFTYELPWSFPFAGKDIVDIQISSNGLIELFEVGEPGEELPRVSSDYDYMGVIVAGYPDSDIIFAWHDDLNSFYYGFYGVEYDSANDVVVVHWETETYDDADSDRLNYFQVWLFPDGSIQWNFKEFNYLAYYCSLGTGIYDSTSMVLLNVAVAMGEPDGVFNTPEKSYKYFGEYLP